MSRFRLHVSVWLLGLLAGWFAVSATVTAQETKPAEPPATTAKPAEKTTPWPPANTQLQEINRDADQKGGLKLYVPATWKKTAPASNLRLAQFEIPNAEGDKDPVELAIFSFGTTGDAGGGVQANINRWIDQFIPKGREVLIRSGEGHQGPYVIVDLKGTYNMPIGPPIRQQTKELPNARMLAVILGIKGQGVYFLRMAGGEKTVTAQADAFRAAFGAAHIDNENPIEEKEAEPQGDKTPPAKPE